MAHLADIICYHVPGHKLKPLVSTAGGSFTAVEQCFVSFCFCKGWEATGSEEVVQILSPSNNPGSSKQKSKYLCDLPIGLGCGSFSSRCFSPRRDPNLGHHPCAIDCQVPVSPRVAKNHLLSPSGA